MKWFWYSLLGFCLLMCSCKTQRLDSDVKIRNKIRSDLAYLNDNVKINTQNQAYFDSEVQRIVIEEDITVTEYDKETGKPTKETKTTRKTAQDTNKVSTEEENQGVTESTQTDATQSTDITNDVDAEVKEESVGGQESFGKWLAIACVIAGIILYLWKRLKNIITNLVDR